MKWFNYKILAVLALLVFSGSVSASTQSERIVKNFSSSHVKKLIMEAQFGQVTIKASKDKQVQVSVSVEASDKDKACTQQIIDNIDVSVSLVMGVLYVETDFDSRHKSKGNFSIEYEISMPSDIPIIAELKYCDIDIEHLAASGMFEVTYGDINIERVSAENNLIIDSSYGNANIGSANNVVFEAKYGTFNIGKANTVVSDTKNCTLNIGSVHTMHSESKYDKVSIGSVNVLTIPCAYSTLSVGELKEQLVAEVSYGSVNVASVSRYFKQIRMENKYGKISLGMQDGSSYNVDVYGSYCSFKLPEINETTFIKEKHSLQVIGSVGSNPQGTLSFVSNYGSFTLRSKP